LNTAKKRLLYLLNVISEILQRNMSAWFYCYFGVPDEAMILKNEWNICVGYILDIVTKVFIDMYLRSIRFFYKKIWLLDMFGIHHGCMAHCITRYVFWKKINDLSLLNKEKLHNYIFCNYEDKKNDNKYTLTGNDQYMSFHYSFKLIRKCLFLYKIIFYI
jgi:hypothetical protein